MIEDRYTNTVQDAAEYERKRGQSDDAHEFQDSLDYGDGDSRIDLPESIRAAVAQIEAQRAKTYV